MTHDTYEGDHRNRPVEAEDRRSNQTCLLMWFLCGLCQVKLVHREVVICGSRRMLLTRGKVLILRLPTNIVAES
jgi:hypothetical protein